jgi:hypothetical protein
MFDNKMSSIEVSVPDSVKTGQVLSSGLVLNIPRGSTMQPRSGGLLIREMNEIFYREMKKGE